MRTDSPDITSLLESASFFLQQVDSASASLRFLRTDRDILSRAPFIDGRTPIAADHRIYQMRLEDALAAVPVDEPDPTNRYLFHMSFCGSTLLARTLDVPGRSFTYKEPQALIDLATIKRAGHPWFRDRQIRDPLLALVLRKFRLSWSDAEVAIVKPSNWANNLLPELLEAMSSRAIFLTTAPRDFLIAVLRGGDARVRFTGRLLDHLQSSAPAYAESIDLANACKDPLESICRHILLVHQIQASAFEAATNLIEPDRYRFLSFDDLRSNPLASLTAAATTLDLRLSAAELDQSIVREFGFHAKSNQEPWNPAALDETDRMVAVVYGRQIDGALAWITEVTAAPLLQANS